MVKKMKVPTATSQVMRVLVEADDMLTCAVIAKRSGETPARVMSALGSLKEYHAVDCVEQKGRLWWFANPPELDTRSKHFDERAPEDKPRRTKRKLGSEIIK